MLSRTADINFHVVSEAWLPLHVILVALVMIV